MRKITIILTMIFILAVSGTAKATLFDRGGGLIYDSNQNITWLQNANLANQQFTWQESVDWAAALVFQGFDDWQLPTADPNCGFAFNCINSELGHMFYNNLGGAVGNNLSGNQFANPPDMDFTLMNIGGGQIQSLYWSGTEFAPGSGSAWSFNFTDGFQNTDVKFRQLSAWAVRDGDSAPIPEPSTLLLLFTGLIGLAAWRRRKAA